eukprot:g81034.t1
MQSDYHPLENEGASARYPYKRAVIGVFGSLFILCHAFASSLSSGFFLQAKNNHGNEESNQLPPFAVPSEGVEEVLTKPKLRTDPIRAMQMANGIYCIFSYGVDSAKDDNVGLHVRWEDGWVYGMKLKPADTLAVVTGDKGDLLKGRLVCYTSLNMVDKLKLSDTLRGYNANKPTQSEVRRRVIKVVTASGASKRAYTYYREADVTQAGPSAQRREELKAAILKLADSTDRGVKATSEEQSTVLSLFEALEQLNPDNKTLASPYLSGTWELRYTTSKSLLGQKSKTSKRLGKILQVIDVANLKAANAEVVQYFGFLKVPRKVTADLTPLTDNEVAVQFKEFSIGPLKIKAPNTAQGRLKVTYIDHDIRLSRGDKGSIFVLVRDSDSLEIPPPTPSVRSLNPPCFHFSCPSYSSLKSSLRNGKYSCLLKV